MIGLPKRYKAAHSPSAIAAAKEKKVPPVDTGRLRISTARKFGVVATLAGAAGFAAHQADPQLFDWSPAHEAPRVVTPAEQRAAVAKSIVLPFDQCRIVSVTDEHRKPPKDKGTGTTITIKVVAPLSAEGAKATDKYKNDKTVTSTAPVGIGVVLDPKKPYETTPLSLLADDNKKDSSDVSNGSGEFKLYAPTNAPAGTRIGVYVLKTVQMDVNGQQEQYAGAEPCGELELVKPEGGVASWQDYRGQHPSMVPGFAEVPPNVTWQQVEQTLIPPVK